MEIEEGDGNQAGWFSGKLVESGEGGGGEVGKARDERGSACMRPPTSIQQPGDRGCTEEQSVDDTHQDIIRSKQAAGPVGV